VVVPDGEDAGLFFEGGVVGLVVKLLVNGAEFVHVGGVSVDVVAHKEEELGRLFGDDAPDVGLAVVGLIARAEGDFSDDLVGLGFVRELLSGFFFGKF